MPTIKDRVFKNDSYAIEYECVIAVDETANSYQFNKTTLNPSSGTALLWDVQNSVYVQLGVGVDQAACTISGSTISYTVPGTKLGVEGDYKLFITAVFPDGQIVTESRSIKVVEKQ